MYQRLPVATPTRGSASGRDQFAQPAGMGNRVGIQQGHDLIRLVQAVDRLQAGCCT